MTSDGLVSNAPNLKKVQGSSCGAVTYFTAAKQTREAIKEMGAP